MPWVFEDELQQSAPEKNPPSGGYWVFEDELNQPEESDAKSAFRTAVQAPLGYSQAFTYPVDIGSEVAGLAAQGAAREAYDEGEAMQEARRLFPQDFHAPITEEQKQPYLQQLRQNFPTRSNLERILEEQTGLPLQAQSALQKALRLSGGAAGFKGGGLGQKAGAAAIAPAVSETAQAVGVPEEVAELGGLVASGVPIPSIRRGEKAVEKFASGLTKPRAVESKYAKYGTLSKEAQEHTIKKLDEEASKLASSVLEKEKPLIKKINEGYDFDKKFEEGFGKIKKTAAKFDPQLNITPVTELMQNSRKELRGIPSLSPASKKIMKETQAFSKRPAISLYENLKTYRENNKKLKDIFEKSRLQGTQKEYVNFLQDYNQAIKDSMKNTLPKKSAWMKEFEALNKEFSEYLNAKKSSAILEPIFGKEISMNKIEKLANDPKLQKRLSLNLGEKGTQEVVQIAKDLHQARSTIQSIPQKEINLLKESLPAGYILADFLPFGKLLKIPYGVKVSKDYAQKALGHYLSRPSSRRAYEKVLKEFNNRNPQAFAKAVKTLIDSLEKEE